MEFRVGDKVMLNRDGLDLYGERHQLARGVTVVSLGVASRGPFISWAPNCGGCYNHYLQLMEGPW